MYMTYTMYIQGTSYEILITQYPQFVMLPAIHLKNEIEPDHVPVTCCKSFKYSSTTDKIWSCWIPSLVN